MKIDIITIHTVCNYGTVLQAYATQQTMGKMGYQTEIINYWRDNNEVKYVVKRVLEGSTFWNRNHFTRLLFTILKERDLVNARRKFDEFIEKYLVLSMKKYTSIEELREDPPKADVYCTGSDQTWNSEYNNGIDLPFYLEFVPENAKRISYAASIGLEDFPREEKTHICNLLKKYSNISVREFSAKRILNNMGFNDVTVLIDPTLVLSKNEWIKIMDQRLIKKKYVLIYQLNKDKKLIEYAQTYAKKRGCEVAYITQSHYNKPRGCRTVVLPTVGQFLSLFCYTELVVTDSFHGTAFSLNFERNFIAYLPNMYGNRIESLLSLLGLKDRIISDYSTQQLDEIDYQKVGENLKVLREANIEFLTKTLS